MSTGWLGRAPLWWSAIWGFAEASLFFIVPDLLFTAVTIVSPKRGWQHLAAAIAGAVLAGGLMYQWSAAAPAQARAAVAAVPFVGEKMITPTETLWKTEGTVALFRNPLGGVPYKVPAILAPAHLSLPEFIAISVPYRAERMLLSMIVFIPIAMWVRLSQFRDRDWRQTMGLRFYLVFWAMVYAVYWSVNYS